MEEDYKIIDHYLMIRLPEEIDHHSCSVICRRADHMMLDNSVSHIVFDFSDTKFMDSSGIAVVLRVKKRMEETDGDVFLLDPAPQCARVLRTSGIERFVAIKFTEGKAAR